MICTSMTEEDVNGAPVLALSYFLFFALFFAAAGALLIHSYCIIQSCLFILIESISLSSLCIPCFLPNVFVLTCTYYQLFSLQGHFKDGHIARK